MIILVFYKKVLEETIQAINKCYDKNITDINVRRVRKCNDISSNQRSKINFISRALEDLKKLGYLKFIGRNSPKKYQILYKISDLSNISKKLNLRE